ncbi:1,4-alpha-glucan branching protein GlgB [Granulicatella sp. zg-84]|uniref:1,4-alpha-glucan branching protein GlgB n=1 Tax=Granulicatella sp. zg-84 TaxID=2678503 RepID=UPI001F086620|nr:1,4-alpha-glucan branching protein GlgB [Granulicatella sp. zg-84]
MMKEGNITKNLYQEWKDDIYLFNIGQQYASYRFLGNHFVKRNETVYVSFAVWAPHAKHVYLVGDFNDWTYERMTCLEETGIWLSLSEKAKSGDCYKYVIEDEQGNTIYKIDPFAKKFERPPKDASIVYDVAPKKWKDGLWQANKKRKDILEKPLNIYEIHAGSWKRHLDGTLYSFDDFKKYLVPYVKDMGYTHIEFMPLMEHPLEESWGYQVTGYYAVASIFGDLDAFRDFVEYAHQQGIGIIMDWVPGHFCRNAYALAYYDGTPTYEYSDEDRANNQGWGTLNFDLGKPQVQSFLISNALFWLDVCHVDGIRVDAVSNILYLDFDNLSWKPNKYGDNRNLEGIDFLKQLNTIIYRYYPTTLMIAEESTSFDGVTRPVYHGGLGFLFKWNMGWMNDTLAYIETDTYVRKDYYRLMTFSFMYMFHDQFILPLSHDEVVHGKNSMLGKIKGDRYKQFATLRLLQAYMIAHPGKKLNFMGYELGQFLEWRFYSQLEWIDLQRPFNQEYQYFIKTINHLYQSQKALYEVDTKSDGITVLDADNIDESIISFIRHGKQKRDFLIMIANFLPIERLTYRVGVPYEGQYEILLNTEAKEYGGTWTHTKSIYQTEKIPYQNQPYSFECVVPSLAALYIKPKRVYIKKEMKELTV